MRWFKPLFVFMLLILIFGGTAVYLLLRGSLARLDGQLYLSTLPIENTQQVTIDRDYYGTAVITAPHQHGAVYALGFAHAQDRFVQMDMLRRAASGRLSELFGQGTLDIDKMARAHQFENVAKRIVANLNSEQRELLVAYRDGVNAGLADLAVAPFEYLLTSTVPEPWRLSDSFLVLFAMYMDLQLGQVERDIALSYLHDMHDPQWLDFILQPTDYQAALDASRWPLTAVTIPARLPTQTSSSLAGIADDLEIFAADIGSNNWAVAGSLTANGLPQLSNDMHLGLNVPAIWYRAQLNYANLEQTIQVTGVSLPGTPAIVVGATDKVAWGFTNANLDNVDWIRISKEETYTHTEQINILNDSENVTYLLSDLGPVRKINDQYYALQWIAHSPHAANMDLASLPHASNVSELLQLAKTIRMPVQNMVMADSSGHIAYRPTGAVSARTTVSNIAKDHADTLFSQTEMHLPVYHSEKYDRIWSANSRVLSTEEISRFGDGGYALGARSQQIRDFLESKTLFNQDDFYHLLTDQRALFMKTWYHHLHQLLSQHPQRYQAELALLSDWNNCQCTAGSGYTLARKFRDAMIRVVFAELHTSLQAVGIRPSALNRHLEGPLQQLIQTQPQAWLPAEYTNWQDYQLAIFDQAMAKLVAEYGEDLSWQRVNALKVQHPFSQAMPWLASLLDMPIADSLGDSFVPAVQNGKHGASQRLIVQPGNLADAVLTVPGGNSAHPLSDYYRRGFKEYIQAEQQALLPGPIEHSLQLRLTN